MPGSRIPSLTAIAGASTANDDNLVIFDTDANTTKRILRSQLAAGLVGDLPYTPAGFVSATTVPTAIAEIASDIAATSGSALVGYLPAGTGAVATTVQAKLRESVSVADFGDGIGTAAFQAAIDALPANGGHILVPEGDYSVSVVPASLTTGAKAITWVAPTATLPADMPGVSIKTGVFSLPETSFQANRNVRVHDRRVVDTSQATASTRQYAVHVDGYLYEDATTDERELRAFSYDVGTDVAHLQADIRGIKGRVYANGGSGNLRSMYAFAEAVGGSGFTGQLTGFLSTVYKNGNSASESVGVRSHMDHQTTAAFQAAGAGVNPTDTVSFGYACRTGSGQPLLATTACFQAHGGGAGDMFLGYKDNLDVTLANAPVRIRKNGLIKQAGLYSGQSTIADDAAFSFTPPATSGLIEVFCENVSGAFGKIYFRASGSPLATVCFAGSLFEAATTASTGTTGTDTKLIVSAFSDGKIYIENRTGASRSVVWNVTAYVSG